MANVIVHNLKDQRIERLAPSEELTDFFEYFWKVSWNVAPGKERTQELLTEPKADLYVERGEEGWKIAEIRSALFRYDLKGQGAVFGLKLKPSMQLYFRENGIQLPQPDWKLGFAEQCQTMQSALTSLDLSLSEEMRRVNEMVEFILTHRDLHHVERIHAHFQLEPRTAQRLFKKYLGLSVKWVLNRSRILEALRQSQQGQLSWSKLALELGYADQAHFIRDFKKNCHCTPAEYQRYYLRSLDSQ